MWTKVGQCTTFSLTQYTYYIFIYKMDGCTSCIVNYRQDAKQDESWIIYESIR